MEDNKNMEEKVDKQVSNHHITNPIAPDPDQENKKANGESIFNCENNV